FWLGGEFRHGARRDGDQPRRHNRDSRFVYRPLPEPAAREALALARLPSAVPAATDPRLDAPRDDGADAEERVPAEHGQLHALLAQALPVPQLAAVARRPYLQLAIA